MRKSAHPRLIKLKQWGFIALFLCGVWILLGLVNLVRGSILIGNHWRTTIVFKADPVTVLSFDRTESPIIVTIPTAVFATVPHGYGPYRLESVWKLADQEKNPNLLTETVADLLGVAVDGWIELGESSQFRFDQDDQVISELKQKLTFSVADPTLHTNLNALDRLLLFWRVLWLRPTNVFIYAAHRNGSLFQDQNLPNGTPIKTVRESAFDLFVEQKFEDTKIRKEAPTVTIYNTTSVAGVGQKFSRYLANVGARVVSVANSDLTTPTCLVSAKTDLYLVRFLQEKFGCEVGSGNDTFSDVVIWVGDSYGKRWQ